jgi:hypothetical protein
MAIVTSLLRPARLLVEVDDPEAVRGIISRVKTAGKGPDWEVQFGEQWYRITGEDRWIYTVSLLDILTLRYSVEVAGDYLVISSLPWGRPTRVTETRTLPLAAAGLGVFPGAVHEEAPMLQAAAMEKLREAVFGASNLMMPAMLATGGDPEAARQLHRTAFGFQPVHPGSGNWSWQDGYPVSSTYGRPSRPRQPAAGRDDPAVGLMGGLQSLDVSFQLEGDGLRSVMRWTWGEPEE